MKKFLGTVLLTDRLLHPVLEAAQASVPHEAAAELDLGVLHDDLHK